MKSFIISTENLEVLIAKHCGDAIEVKISIELPTAKTTGYVGAISSWPPLENEDHRRFADLADGPATDETIDKIAKDLKAIIRGYATDYDRQETEKRSGQNHEQENDKNRERYSWTNQR